MAQDNPLVVARAQRPAGKHYDLDSYCDYLNKMDWVKASGLPYVIRYRDAPQGKLERYLDRGVR